MLGIFFFLFFFWGGAWDRVCVGRMYYNESCFLVVVVCYGLVGRETYYVERYFAENTKIISHRRRN